MEEPVMRTLGLTILGLVAGLVAGLLLTDVVARIAMSDGGDVAENLPLAVLLGLVPMILAVLGGVVAPLIDRRAQAQRAARRPPTG
jgi:hypothetical protein